MRNHKHTNTHAENHIVTVSPKLCRCPLRTELGGADSGRGGGGGILLESSVLGDRAGGAGGGAIRGGPVSPKILIND